MIAGASAMLAVPSCGGTPDTGQSFRGEVAASTTHGLGPSQTGAMDAGASSFVPVQPGGGTNQQQADGAPAIDPNNADAGSQPMPGTTPDGVVSGSAPWGAADSPNALADINFTMDATVPAGAEIFRCLYVPFPSDRGVIAAPGAESHYTPGSHHLLAYRTDLTSVPSNQTAPFDCSSESWMVHMRGTYYEAQAPDSSRILPQGVAHKFQPGEVMVLQAHYLNATSASVAAHVLLTVHTVDESMVKAEAGSIFFYDPSISIPAHSQVTVSMTCPVPQDINLALLWSHMHKQGIGFTAATDDPAVASGPLYTSSDWSEPSPRIFATDPLTTIHAGSHITYSCAFSNPNSYTVTAGESAATNEMCILHGMYWPRLSSDAETCRGGTTTSSTPTSAQ